MHSVASALAVAIVALLFAGSAQALMITEVMANPVGGFFGNDDGLEWVELYNESATPVDLSGYSLGWGGADYTYGSLSLAGAGILNPGELIVIGGPVPPPAVNHFNVDFAPDIPDGFINAAGVGLFLGADTSVTPIDAVIYAHIWGGNFNDLIDETGAVGTLDATTGAAAESIERQLDGTWSANATPTPGTATPVPEPGTATLAALGMGLLGIRRRS